MIIGELKNKIFTEPNITFVVLPGQEQHDRTIFTNYKMFTSGDSFKYFKDGANVSLCTHGEWMYISSLHDIDNHQNSKDFISDLQAVIDKVKGGVMSIIGDEKSFSYISKKKIPCRIAAQMINNFALRNDKLTYRI